MYSSFTVQLRYDFLFFFKSEKAKIKPDAHLVVQFETILLLVMKTGNFFKSIYSINSLNKRSKVASKSVENPG